MAAIKTGDVAPEVSGVDQDGQTVRLADYLGQQAVVLFFYPADDSPVCTKEACSFRDAYEQFVEAGAVVLGVSGDSGPRHQQFASKHRLPFRLLTDRDGSIRRAFGVPKTLGIFPGRVTYVLDKSGVVRHVFASQLDAERHVREALEIVEQLR